MIILVITDCVFVVVELIYGGKVKSYDEYCPTVKQCHEEEHGRDHWEHIAHSVHICSILVLRKGSRSQIKNYIWININLNFNKHNLNTVLTFCTFFDNYGI